MNKVGIIALGNKFSGGIYQYTQSLIDALKSDKTREYVIFCSKDDNRFDNYGLEVRKFNKPKLSFLKKVIRAFQLLLFIRKPWFFTNEEINLFKDIDIFISPVISPYPHFFLNKPFVFTLHDMQERYYPEFFSIYERLIRWLNNRTLAKSANKIICESQFVKNDIVKFIGVKEDKILVIPSPPPENFLNYKFDNKKFKKIKEKYKLPEKFIFYPAQCWPHKNHIRLVEAFKIVSNKYKDVYLILTGSKQNNFNNLIQKINELNLNDKIKYLGYIDYEELPYIYKMSQFLVMPTLFESVSIPIYEAFALKVAVCSSNVTALPEQVGDAGLIFDPYNIEDIAKKMILYLENENLRKEKARLGFEKIINFDHNNYRQKLLEILNNI